MPSRVSLSPRPDVDSSQLSHPSPPPTTVYCAMPASPSPAHLIAPRPPPSQSEYPERQTPMRALGLHLTDCEITLSAIKHQEKQLRLKRRWLMGLPLSQWEQKRFEGPEFLKEKILPESLLREDDTFYETARYRVEEAFGERSTENECSVTPENFEPFDLPKTMRRLRSRLNDLTSRGLHHLAMIISGGSSRDLRTRQSMRKVVKESLPKALRKHRNNECNCELCRQLYQFLSDPRYFRGNKSMFLAPATRSAKAAVIKILDRLEGFPFQVLLAIYRKLKEKPIKASSKCGRSRDQLVKQVRKTSMKMLSQLGEKDVLQEPLAKAMTTAVLSLKLTSGPQSFWWSSFCGISSEMRTLQDDIVKAVWLLRTKEFQSQELNKLRLLFEPSGRVPSKYIKPKVKNILLEYLFECSDMDAIPKSVLQGLAFINQKSRAIPNMHFSEDELEQEVECLLDLSAQTKQIAWDLLPENQYYKGFADAYLEELHESDDESGDEDGDLISPKSLKADGSETELLIEGFGESTAVNFGQSPAPFGENNMSPVATVSRVITAKPEPVHYPGVNSASPWYTGPAVLFQDSKFSEGRTSMELDGGCTSDLCSSKAAADDTTMASHVGFSANLSRCKVENDAPEDQEQYPGKDLSCRNQYLSIQDACDDTSLIAYNLVGFMLEELAQEEGLELDQRERFYLKGDQSVEDVSVGRKKKASSWEDVKMSAIHRAVQKLIPSLETSVMEKVEQIMDLR